MTHRMPGASSTYWSEYVQEPEELYCSRALRFREDNKDAWLRLIGAGDGMRILEVGCGSGLFREPRGVGFGTFGPSDPSSPPRTVFYSPRAGICVRCGACLGSLDAERSVLEKGWPRNSSAAFRGRNFGQVRPGQLAERGISVFFLWGSALIFVVPDRSERIK